MTRRILIIGAAGFVGVRAVAKLRAAEPSWDIVGATLNGEGDSLAFDVTDPEVVDRNLKDLQPDAILHLAAVAAPVAAASDPHMAWQVNVLGVLNVVLAIERFSPSTHLFFVSSSEVYGRSALPGTALKEDAPLLPATSYGVTKASADLMVQEAAARRIRATVLRPFNHTGPGQTEAFVVPSFCAQVARIEAGLKPPTIMVGDLGAERDFLDADDVVDLYCAALRADPDVTHQQILNIASGQPRKIATILDDIVALAKVPVTVVRDPSRMRPTEIPRMFGSAKAAHRLLNWQTRRRFEDTLLNTLDYWRERVL
jgi:GDP-4-dehydro-6-deoxy-D-mannose reductase